MSVKQVLVETPHGVPPSEAMKRCYSSSQTFISSTKPDLNPAFSETFAIQGGSFGDKHFTANQPRSLIPQFTHICFGGSFPLNWIE